MAFIDHQFLPISQVNSYIKTSFRLDFLPHVADVAIHKSQYQNSGTSRRFSYQFQHMVTSSDPESGSRPARIVIHYRMRVQHLFRGVNHSCVYTCIYMTRAFKVQLKLNKYGSEIKPN